MVLLYVGLLGNAPRFTFVFFTVFIFQLRDGSESTSRVIGHFCGSQIPDPVISTTSSVRVEFISDSAVRLHGFRLSWRESTETDGSGTTSGSGNVLSADGEMVSVCSCRLPLRESLCDIWLERARTLYPEDLLRL